MEITAEKATLNMEKLINSKLESSTALRQVAKKIRDGRGTYQDLYAYSRMMSAAVKDTSKSELLKMFGTTEITQLDAVLGSEIIRSVLTDYHGKLIDIGAVKMNKELEQLSLNIKPIKTEATNTRLLDLTKPIEEASTVNEMLAVFEGDKIDQFYNASLDELIQENADFRYEAGLTPVISRSCGGESCAFCQGLEGVYEYDGTSDCGTGENIFARHTGCTCIIDVRTTRGGNFERVNNYRRR